MKLAALPLFVFAGAFLAGGALALVHFFGPEVARELGDAGGVGFTEGVARAQAAAERFAAGAAVSGNPSVPYLIGRGDYRRALPQGSPRG